MGWPPVEACGHKGEAKKAFAFPTWHDRVVAFDSVSAEVCSQCGETLFAGPVVDKLNRLLWSMTPATRPMQAAVYDLSVA
jgi:YgiT-type zinc finger domain-containing protein